MTKRIVLQTLAAKEAVTENRLLVLQREHHDLDKTEGYLYTAENTYNTIELPDRNNAKNISCIPTGTYTWQKIHRSSNGQPALWIRDVPNRTEILIHYGLHPSHSQGCILIKEINKFINELPKKGIITIL